MKRRSGKDRGEGNSPKAAHSKPTVIKSFPHQTDAIDRCLTDWWSAWTFHQARENKVEVSSRPRFRLIIVIYFGPVHRLIQLKYAFLSWNTQDPKVYIRFWGNFIRWKLCSHGICKTQLFQSIPAIARDIYVSCRHTIFCVVIGCQSHGGIYVVFITDWWNNWIRKAPKLTWVMLWT